MTPRFPIAALLLMACTAACQSFEPQPVRALPQGAIPFATRGSARTAGEEGQPELLLGHSPSGIVFPAHLGEFTREDVTELDDDGLRIAITYTRWHLRDRLNATIFVYPAHPRLRLGSPVSLSRPDRNKITRGSFERAKEAITSSIEGSREVLADELVTRFLGKERDAHLANFRFTDSSGFVPITFGTSLSLFGVEDWEIKMRLTAPLDSLVRAAPKVTESVQAFVTANSL